MISPSVILGYLVVLVLSKPDVQVKRKVLSKVLRILNVVASVLEDVEYHKELCLIVPTKSSISHGGSERNISKRSPSTG